MPFERVTRRHLLLSAAGATVLAGSGGLWLAVRKLQGRRWAKAVPREQAFSPNVYLAIDEEGQTTIWLTKSEMGQGVHTALPMLVAEELDADWSKVRVEQAIVSSNGPDYGDQYTAASASVRSMWHELRKAGAAARHMLIEAASEHWSVSASECQTQAGEVIHLPTGKRASYGSLARAAGERSAPWRVELKDPSQFKLLGKDTPRLDLLPKTTGTARYGLDVRIDGQRYAVLSRCPVAGGRLTSVDTQPALQVPGVEQVIELESAVAVVATNTWAAQQGALALRPEFTIDDFLQVSDDDVTATLQRGLAERSTVADEQGQAEATLEGLPRKLSRTYQLPYLAHAPMEPLNCTAHVKGDHCELWAPTQNPEEARDVAARVAGIPGENVTVHTTFLGGGFGRRSWPDEVEDLIAVAQKVEHPVQLVFPREQDIRHSRYREASYHELEGGLDEAGRLQAWVHRFACPSLEGSDSSRGEVDGISMMGARNLPYAVPHSKVIWASVDLRLPISIWRSVGFSYNTFAIESFVDELAHEAKADPVEFRLAMLSSAPRLAACLRKVAELADWPRPRQGAALGVAAVSCFGSHIAQVLEVALGEQGYPRVRRAWCVVDCGSMVNPDTVRAQVEGGTVFGLTAALYGRISLRAGAIQESNFDDYRLLRMSEMPEIEVFLIRNQEEPGGIGEVAVPGVAPALSNALFRLTGERRRDLPLGHRVG